MSEIELIGEWVRTGLGGEVVAIERQTRWRPNWLVDADVDGEPIELMVRGHRIDSPLVFPLHHEMTFQDLLYRNGIPVPKVYGWLDALPAYVMDRVPGRPDFADSTVAERDAVMAEYMRTLARIHALNVDEFEAAGITRASPPPSTPGSVGMAYFEKLYRQTKRRPDPFVEFALGWLRRNPLPANTREAPVVWDSGQFHHRDGKITALLDLEIGHIGDPMMDLAAFRMRDTVLNFGDFDELYGIYAEAGGVELDMAAIQHHHLSFTLTNELAFHGALAAPSPGSAYMTNLQWCTETNLHSVEAFAELLGYDLDETIDVPEPAQFTNAVAFQHLVQTLGSVTIDEPFARYEVRNSFRLARHLLRRQEIGAQLDEQDLDDLTALLGHRPRVVGAADAELEHFVLADDGRHDEALVQLFYRRFLRANAVLGPAGSAMTAHRKVQPFTR
ncbi:MULTISPECIES: phosphotransferase family protein [Mycolicibacterium]|uniref:phosphotransferase family protein n=1 Tax=Mycolicibacterium TaxID=1866885 RepID=UPI000848F888|nr:MULTISPECIES: phosphotransferase family protein [Mycolicibacterium]ODR27546.1 protein kinase [Mycolicibacterium porcinum]